MSGKKGLTEAEAAHFIIKEARQLVQAELGSVGIEWCPQVLPKSTNVSSGKGVSSSEGGQSLSDKEKGNAQKCKAAVTGDQSADQPQKRLSNESNELQKSGQELKSSDLKLSNSSNMKEVKSLQSESKMMEEEIGDSASLPRKNSGLKKKWVLLSYGKSSEVKNHSRLVDQPVIGLMRSSVVKTENSQGKNVKSDKNVEKVRSSLLVQSSRNHLQKDVKVTGLKTTRSIDEDESTASLPRKHTLHTLEIF